jgi:hypothetical protein
MNKAKQTALSASGSTTEEKQEETEVTEMNEKEFVEGMMQGVTNEPIPLTPPLSLTGGEGARRAGEGDRFMQR